MSTRAHLGAFALAVSSCLLPNAAHALCNANDLASFLNCAATAPSSDIIVLGANIDVTGSPIVVNNDVSVANGAFMLTGSTPITKDGPGSLILTGVNGFAPGALLSINQGAVLIAVPGALPSTVQVNGGGSSLVALVDMTLPGNIQFGTSGTNIVAAAPGRTLTLSGLVQTASASAQFNDTVNNGTIRIAAIGGAVNSATALIVQSGAVEDVSTHLTIMTANAGSTTVMSGASIRFGAAAVSFIGNLQGNGNVGETVPATVQVFSGDFGGQITVYALQKANSGVLRLSGTSSPTTQTQVLAGTLVLDGTLTTLVNVFSGATLRGSGTVTNNVSLPAGSILAPGANTAGATAVLTLQGVSLTGGQYIVDIAGPFAYDRVIANTLVAGTSATLSLGVVAPALPLGTVVTVLTNAGNVTPLPFTFTGLPEGATLTGGGNTFVISYVGGDGNDVMLTVASAPAAPTLVSATPGNGTATLAFTPNSNGGSPILDYTATCGAAPPVTLATSPIVVTGLPNGVAASCTVTARNAVGSSPPSNALMVTPVQPSFSGPSATGSGTITAILSGGGAGCTFAPTPAFIPVSGHPRSPPAGSAPQGVNFPHGLFDFTLTGCTPGSTVTILITYPSGLFPDSSYYKYGPTPGNVTPHWYILPAVLGGTTATISITDGGLGDDDLAANGTIVDQGGPGAGAQRQVPTLSEWMLMVLAALMVGGAVLGRRRV